MEQKKQKLVIAFTGPKGSGKSEVAGMLLDILGQRDRSLAEIVSFAEPVKDFFKKMGWNGVKDEKGRRGLQLLGTDVGRKCIDDNIWVDMFVETAERSYADIIINDDMRFINEADAVRNMGGVIVGITGREEESVASDLDEHESEKPILANMVDFYVNNSPGRELFDVASELISLTGYTIEDCVPCVK